MQGVGAAPECVNVTVNGTSTLVPHYPPPRFSVTVFMYCLAMLLLLSLAGFFILDCSPWGLGQAVRHRYLTRTIRSGTLFPVTTANTDYVSPDSSACSKLSVRSNTSSRSRRDSYENSAVEKDPAVGFAPTSSREVFASSSEPVVVWVPTALINNRQAKLGLQTGEFVLAIMLLAYASLLTNGFLPAFQSYSSAAYSSLTYHLAVTLSGVVCAVVAVVATYLVHRSKLAQSARTRVGDRTHDGTDWATGPYISHTQMAWLLVAGLASAPAGYVIFLATTSPNPPSLGGFGPILAVMSWILLRAGFSGLRTWLWLHVSSRSDEPMALRYAGLATQIGAALGAIASFLLVVQFHLFQPKYPC
ncbi:hypothetical protein P879_01713 [Paragonimus westermani]|uniref:Riboflavin transporter n=1 Tax=Paragonimus westermani TaxID=34504 RepID=A0A8T0DRS3_9TREM|nr:hypothetical protein P879_01713 [Paragonimus westermani]